MVEELAEGQNKTAKIRIVPIQRAQELRRRRLPDVDHHDDNDGGGGGGASDDGADDTTTTLRNPIANLNQ